MIYFLKRGIYFILAISCFCNLNAQDRPDFMPEDIEATTFQTQCLCKPGVANKSRARGIDLSFLHTSRSPLNEEDGFPLSAPFSNLTLQQLLVKIRIPVVNKDGFKVLVGAIYRSEHYDFEPVGADYSDVFSYLDDRNLKSSGLESIISKSWNEKIYTSFRMRAIYNGDYSGLINFGSEYAIYNVSGLFGVKSNDTKEWGIGLSFSSSFRSTVLLPFFLYNKTYNDKWGIELVLPAIASLRYNISESSLLVLGARYNSRSYAIGNVEQLPQVYNFNHSEIRFALTLEQKLHPWIWMDATVGFQHNFSTDFNIGENQMEAFQVEPGSSPYFKLGIFISPPDSFLR